MVIEHTINIPSKQPHDHTITSLLREVFEKFELHRVFASKGTLNSCASAFIFTLCKLAMGQSSSIMNKVPKKSFLFTKAYLEQII